MSTASIVYIPPIKFKNTETFVQNMIKFPPAGRLIIISDYNYKPQFPNAEHIVITNPELFAGHRINPTCGISNALFVSAMREVRKRKIDHVLYLEADCRFGQVGWDATVFHEYFHIGFPVIAAGTLMCWNMFNGGLGWIQRYHDLVIRTQHHPIPAHCFGVFPQENRPFNPTIFPNGAGTILSVDWAFELFEGFENMMAIATGDGMEGKAWDWQLGERARKKFGVEVFNLFYHMNSIGSCYGDLSTTEDYRLNLLREKRIAISHQHKGNKTV